MGDCPIPERGVFCISIVDLISKTALVLFSLLCAINYHYKKGSLKVEFIKCKKIHSRLLFIVVLQSKLCQWVIKIVLFLISLYRPRKDTLYAISHWSTMIHLLWICFILYCHVTFFSHKYRIYDLLVFSVIIFWVYQRIP